MSGTRIAALVLGLVPIVWLLWFCFRDVTLREAWLFVKVLAPWVIGACVVVTLLTYAITGSLV